MTLISRRSIVAAGLTAALARPAAAALARIDFEVRRNDSVIGSHSVSFARSGDNQVVTVAVDYLVKFGPITLFRYALRGSEAWRGDSLAEARFETDDDGRKDFMRATSRGGALAVEGSASGSYTAPPGSIIASHWNRREVERPMINPQNGELMTFDVRDGGHDPVHTLGGETLPAKRFTLTGPSTLDLWYEPSGAWAGLRAVARDGSVITYLRRQGTQG